MIDEPHVRQLLSAIMAYDGRKPGDATVIVWSEAARRAGWTYEEALDAVHEHYATETTWLMPAHVTTRIRAARRDAAERQLPPPPKVDAVGQARVRTLVSSTLAPAGEGSAVSAPGPDPRLAAACPHCAAPPGEPCTRTSRSGRVALAAVHPSRLIRADDGAATTAVPAAPAEQVTGP